MVKEDIIFGFTFLQDLLEILREDNLTRFNQIFEF